MTGVPLPIVDHWNLLKGKPLEPFSSKGMEMPLENAVGLMGYATGRLS